MRNLHVYVLAAILALTGIGIFLYKVFVTGLPAPCRASLRPHGR